MFQEREKAKAVKTVDEMQEPEERKRSGDEELRYFRRIFPLLLCFVDSSLEEGKQTGE
jgi:hypothetical protein